MDKISSSDGEDMGSIPILNTKLIKDFRIYSNIPIKIKLFL